MARLANLYGVSEALSFMPKLPHPQRIQKKTTRLEIVSKKLDVEFQEQTLLPSTRRASLCLVAATVALSASSINGVSLAEDNGYWVSDPIPIPPIYNRKSSPHYIIVSLTGEQSVYIDIFLVIKKEPIVGDV